MKSVRCVYRHKAHNRRQLYGYYNTNVDVNRARVVRNNVKIFKVLTRLKICLVLLVFLISVAVIVFTSNGQYVCENLNVSRAWQHKMKLSEVSEVMRSNISKYRSRSQGYLLSIDYSQQTTAGFKTYNQLADIAGLLNLSCVEPFVCYDGLRGGANYKDMKALKLSNLYDFSNIKDSIQSCLRSDIFSFHEFLENASPHVVLVSFITSVSHHQFSLLKNKNMVKFDCHINISQIQNNVRKTLNSWAASYNISKIFKCFSVVLFDARPKHELPLRDILNVLGSFVNKQVAKFGSATVILETWRGIGHSSYFPYVSGFKAKDCHGGFTLEHSQMVISAADDFVEHFNLTQQAVGVHIRGEKLLIDSNWNVTYSIDCLQQLYNFLHDHSENQVSFPDKVYIFHDLDEYGSISCDRTKECKHARPSSY